MTATLPAPTATSWTADQWDAWRDEVRRLAGERDAVAPGAQLPGPGDPGRRRPRRRLPRAVPASPPPARRPRSSSPASTSWPRRRRSSRPRRPCWCPTPHAGCSLADTITADQLRAWKAEHPGAVVVSYVNTTAEVKAETDICCTSSNAVEVVESIPADREVLFLPDQFLGAHVQRVTGRQNMRIWMGECHVHAGISPTDLRAERRGRPGRRAARPPRVRLRHERAVDGLRRAAAHRAGARPLHRRDARRGPADDGEARAGRHRDRHAAPAAPGQPGHRRSSR